MVILPVCLPIHSICTRCLCKPEEGIESLGTGVRGGCDQTRGCGESTKVLAFTDNARETGNVKQVGLSFQRKRCIPQRRGRKSCWRQGDRGHQQNSPQNQLSKPYRARRD